MSSRTYLSIGDVLSLLREEFPDVTISKIRFLESQGLVNPERSPSGYRKFYEHDVERLRWVLRQQREHFLPLKVIRDRLDQGDLDEPPTAVEGNGRVGGQPAQDEADSEAERADEPVAALATVTSLTRVRQEAAAAAGAAPERSEGGPGVRGGPDPADHPSAGPAPEPPAAEPAAPTASSEPPKADPAPTPAPAPTPTPKTTPAPAAPAPSPPTPPRRPAPTPRPSEPLPARADISGASMTAEELCAATGLSAAQVSELESYGLIAGTPVGGVPCYDECALAVGRVAADFARFGVEVRHLRLYRNAVEREMGLVEQLVTPLLRQRNPESRQRAVETADELGHLGEKLHACLLQREQRRLLGG